MTRNISNRHFVARTINELGSEALRTIIEKERPSAIVCTYPFGGIPALLQKSGLSIPTFTVITDFALHGSWVLSKTDYFFVATRELKQLLMQHGMPEHRVRVSGIPIRSSFCCSRPDPRTADPRSILIMAGAYGVLGNLKKIVRRLVHMPDVRLNVVCGRNVKMRQALLEQFGHYPNIRIHGYVEHIHELMLRSGCMITKAGGITLSEAIGVCLPIVIFKPIPGQEKENALYLEQKGAALVSSSVEELSGHVERILTDDTCRREMVGSIRELQTNNAADAIANQILHTIDSRKSKSGTTA